MARLLSRLFGWTSVPSAPTIVSVEATSFTSISVRWKASKNDGGSPITGYVVEYSPTSNPSFETQVVARDLLSVILDGLTPSTEYDVRVRGENAVGRSVPSATKRAKTDDEVTERVDSSGDLEEGESSFVRSSAETSSEDSEEEEADLRVEEEERLLREATKNNDMDSFHRHLDELERLLSDDDRKKRQIKESVLCYAAHLGFNPIVEALIQKGVDINTMSRIPERPDYVGYLKMSPLHWAADGSQLNTMEFLVEKGANLNSKDGYFGYTPLHVAAEEGHTDSVQCLIDKGAEINIKDNAGKTPLHNAAERGHADIAQFLVENGADINIKESYGKTPLDLATYYGREAVVAYFKRAADPNMLEEKLLRKATKNNDMDSFHRHLYQLERLLSDDFKKKRRIKESVLCYAAHLGSTSAVEALIEKVVDINTMSTVPEHPYYGRLKMSPLHWAADSDHVDTVKLLVEKGANLHIKDGYGDTPLHVAADRGHTDSVQYLIDQGAGINVKNNIGRTPLNWAAMQGKEGTVQLLIEKGADMNIKEKHGKTPLHWAAEEGHAGTAQFLVEKGADINIKDSCGVTPLHKAAKWGHVGAVDYLIKAGADVNIKDDDGKTPLDLGTYYRREAVVSYLKRAADPNMLEESGSTGRQQEQRQSPQQTDNSSSEEPSATTEKEETEESDHEEIDLQVKKLLEKYHHQPKIKHKSLKCLFTGPPRVGKTTLKKRLLRVIKNLITSGVVSPSGGLEKPISVIIGETRECVTVVMESDIDWKPQHDLLDEAQIVLEFIDRSHHRSLPTSRPTTVLPKPVSPTPFPATAILAPATPDATTAVPSKSAPDSPTPREGEADTLEDAKKLMQEVLSSRKLHSIKDIEKTTTLYFMDTGGQPEFHDIMPIILNGPALHLIFFNLTFDLNDPISIQFCKPDGTNSTITYKSSYTGKQMIYQLLSSLYYLSKDLSPDSKPAAVLIATYLDKLKDMGEQGEKKIDEISHSLNKLLNNTEFHSKGFLTYPTEGKATVFIPINNYSGDEEEIHRLQAFLKRVIDDRFAPVELPSSWLLFHLVLRHRYENSPGVCKLAECQALARGCGLDEKDVPQVLQYIHRHLGTILFYEEVEGLNELVICDPNVLFNSIYHLVAVSFAGVRAHHTSADEVRKTGEIPSEELQHISSQPSSSLLTTKHIVDLLKHFKILTEMVSDDSLTYFMPCLLHQDSLELSCEALKSLGPPPLLICFDGNYIPIGVFSALVVKLSQRSWEPDREIRYRNHILFHTDGVFPVELRVQPGYLEFHIRITNYKEEEPTEIHEFCMEVCKTVVDTLKSILNLHEHTKKTKFQLGFYCPGSFQADGQPHFSGCLPRHKHMNPKSFLCSKSPRCQEQCRLPPECTIWFDCWKDKTTGRVWDYVCNFDYTSRKAAASTPLTLKEIQNELKELTAAKWYQLGVQLEIPPATLSTIQCDHPYDAQGCMTEVINRWLRNTPECSWAKLAQAVEAMGDYAALAEKLRQKTSHAVMSGNKED